MKTYKVTYKDYMDANSKEEALANAMKDIASLFEEFAKVKEVEAEGK